MAAQWETLFAVACDLIDQVNAVQQIIDEWSLGGGTAMMLQIGHRESDDIDVFLSDPQLLPYLDPARQDFRFKITPAGYSTDGAAFLKIAFGGVGEIDFIIGRTLTDQPSKAAVIGGRDVRLETVQEIIAKKIFFRGLRIAPRDIFDIAAASRAHREFIVSSLASYKPQVERALHQIDASSVEFITEVIAQLQIRPAFEDAKLNAVHVARDVLKEALAATPASGT
jgi:hypothetical protein